MGGRLKSCMELKTARDAKLLFGLMRMDAVEKALEKVAVPKRILMQKLTLYDFKHSVDLRFRPNPLTYPFRD